MDKQKFDQVAIAITTKTIQEVQSTSKTPLPDLALVTLTAFGKRLLDNLWEELTKK